MAVTAIVASTVVAAGSAYIGAKASSKAADAQADAAQREAEQERLRTEREIQIAKEKKAADITMAAERLAFEKETRGEKAAFTIGQMDKVENELRASAIAGYAASGIDIGKSSSALAVFRRISSESDVQEDEVRKDYESFAKARDIEFQQLRTTEELSYDWFTSRIHQESEWTIQNKYAEASAYRTKAKYATYGGYLGVGSALASGYKDYQFRS